MTSLPTLHYSNALTRTERREKKWPWWKTVAFVAVFCGGFWAGVIWLILGTFE